jgi:site-specific recombinase XerD
VNPAHLSWVITLLRTGSQLPEAAHERLAFSLCKSLAASTLGDYIRHIGVLERYMGAPFVSWVDLDDAGLHSLVATLLASNVAGSTINCYLSAVGTFAAWLNKPRPRTELVSYLIRGEKASTGPMPKIRVHHFPVVEVLANLTKLA